MGKKSSNDLKRQAFCAGPTWGGGPSHAILRTSCWLIAFHECLHGGEAQHVHLQAGEHPVSLFWTPVRSLPTLPLCSLDPNALQRWGLVDAPGRWEDGKAASQRLFPLLSSMSLMCLPVIQWEESTVVPIMPSLMVVALGWDECPGALTFRSSGFAVAL